MNISARLHGLFLSGKRLSPYILTLMIFGCGGGGSSTGNSPPSFTAATVHDASENITFTGYLATANDPDGDALTYSISGGEDQSIFTIASNNGAISFLVAPDFEAPTDANADNSYIVEVTVSDGSLTDVMSVTFIVRNNIAEITAPVFTSLATHNAPENSVVTGYQAQVFDSDGGSSTFSLSGGVDVAAFTMDSVSGLLSFVTAPNFELPTDSDGNNTYIVEITADDGTHTVPLTLTVTVTNLAGFDFFATQTGGIKTVQFNWSVYTGATFYKLFVNPDAASGYTILQDNITVNTTTIDIPVHLTDWGNVSYILEVHDGSGLLATSEAVGIASFMLDNIGYFKASNIVKGFGNSQALSGDGNTLVVGTFDEASNAVGINGDDTDFSASRAGAAYVYIRNGNNWEPQAYIKASNTQAEDRFGYSVAISNDGNTLAVAAIWEGSNTTVINGDETNDLALKSGAVYVYIRTGSTWMQQAYIKAFNAEASDEFGLSIALNGDGSTLAIGAHREDSAAIIIDGDETDNMAQDSGSVYVYARSGVTWSHQAYIKSSNTSTGDFLGYVVTLSSTGDTLLASTYNTGDVYVFTRSGTTWLQQDNITAPFPSSLERFGASTSVSANGSTIAIGATGESSISSGINGDETNDSLTNSGAVYIYELNVNVWEKQAFIKAMNPDQNDGFGASVTISSDGNILAVGAPAEDSLSIGVDGSDTTNFFPTSDSGAVYTFTRNANLWSSKSYVKAPNAGSGDRFGVEVDLSADGGTLAVSATGEDSVAKDVGGVQSNNSLLGSGAVYLY